ncbi:response regulator transcription factor [Cellulomonas sp. JH27-2]|uniref:response regulator transcription factor n=1 Tax=Cellulomonas sp. JH27-2 TaxID=2774139 RepID=UPI001784AD16|nr:LuxR C-terminal-related transcriptional regulator [Cellulomonas sp. JH27-2]MBD8058503.1 response regulator transcription factor [Cellulomonas sp. JH27-2]
MTSSIYLSRRERVILAHLALPITLSQIGASLYVSRNTVKTQVQSIYRKLGVTDRESAVAVARERGYLDEEHIQPEARELVTQRGRTSDH